MNAIIAWWKNHGDKLSTTITAVILLLEKADPAQLTALFGDKAPLWVAFVSGVIAVYHTVFVTPTTPVLQQQIIANAPASGAGSLVKMVAWAGILTAMFSALPGCASTTPSFNQLISAAGQVDVVIVTTTDSLVKSRAITSTDASAVLTLTDRAQAALTLANTAYAANDQTTAAAKLAAASGALAAIQACLATPSTLPVCLQGVTAP